MSYINNDVIMDVYSCNSDQYTTVIENNESDLIPLQIYGSIVLMSDNRLYSTPCQCLNLLTISSVCVKPYVNENYAVKPENFTDRFVTIDSKYYEICNGMSLSPIIDEISNINNIRRIVVRGYYYHCYVNKYAELILRQYNSEHFKFSDRCNVFNLIEWQTHDSNVDDLIYCGSDYECDNDSSSNNFYIIYKKEDKYICAVHNNYCVTDTYNINYEGRSIIKTFREFILDANNTMYSIMKIDEKFTFKKIDVAIPVYNFNLANNLLLVLDMHNKLYCTDITESIKNFTFIDNDCDFNNLIIKTKAATSK